jgi:Tol biopolymer transport system component
MPQNSASLPGRIAFSCCDIDDIYMINPDGSGRTQLTTDSAPDFDPSWSPDSAQIAFRSERDGNLFDVFSVQTPPRRVLYSRSKRWRDTNERAMDDRRSYA